MRIVFMGTPEAAVPTLRRCVEAGHEVVAVWTQPDRPSGRGNKLTASPVKKFALDNNLPVIQPAKIKTEESKALFASHKADVAVVVAYGRILPAEFLSAPRCGCVNVHFSLLPKYRGAAPVNWAIANGERATGVTTMFVAEQLDAGLILLQSEVEIGATETAPELMMRLAPLGAELLDHTLEQLSDITPRLQRDEIATFAPILKKEDGAIDWTAGAATIERRIRAFQPWPNAYTTFRSHQLTIWRASAGKEIAGANDCAGEVIEATGNNLVLKCGGGTSLCVHELQAEGKRRMSTLDFINGSHIQTGECLGDGIERNPKRH